jgi:hypothetical protein
MLGLATMDLICSFGPVNTVVALGRQEWSKMEQARYNAEINLLVRAKYVPCGVLIKLNYLI